MKIITHFFNKTNIFKTLNIMEDSRNRASRILINWFKVIYTDFLRDNKGYANPLDYIAGVYGDLISVEADKIFWAKIARRAGHRCIKRGGIYYFEA